MITPPPRMADLGSLLLSECFKAKAELAEAKAELAEAEAKIAKLEALLREPRAELDAAKAAMPQVHAVKPHGASTGHSQGVAAPPLPPGPYPPPRGHSYASVAEKAASIVPPKEPSSDLKSTPVEGPCCVDGCYNGAAFATSRGPLCGMHSKFTTEVSHVDEAPLCVECERAGKHNSRDQQIRVAYALLPRGPRGRKAVFIEPHSTLCWTCSAKKEREERENQLKEEFGLSYVAPEERAQWRAYRAPQPPNRLAEAVGTAFHADE